MKKYLLISVLLFGGVLIAYADIPNAKTDIILQECGDKVCIKKASNNVSNKEDELKTSDIVAEINGESTENLTLEEVQSKLIGKKDTKVSIKILHNEEYYIFGFKKYKVVPYNFTLVRNHDIDENQPVRVFKSGDNYKVKMKYEGRDLSCTIVYRKINKLYNRELRCGVCTDYEFTRNNKLNNTVKLPTETWKNLDELTYRKYDVYSIWHNNPESTIKNAKELEIAQSFYNSKRCKGVYKYDVVTGNSFCSEWVNMLEGMTKQEKEDYFRAKNFEEEYKNYKKYRVY